MAGRIIRATGATFDGTTIDGVRSFEYSIRKIEKRGRSDGDLGETSANTIEERLSGTLTSDSEYNDDADLLMTGADGVLVVNFKEDGGTTKAVTIGVAGDNSGVVFTSASETISNIEGRPSEMRFTWEGKYHADHTTTIGDATAFTNGTVLMKIDTAA